MPSFGTSTLGRLTGKRNANATARDNASTTDLTTLPLNRSLTSSHAGTGGSGSGSGSELQQDRGRNWNPHRRDSSILSLTRENLTDLGGSVKRSISLRSHRTNLSSGSSFGHKTRSPSGGGGAAAAATTTNVFTPLTSTSPIDSPDGITHFSPFKGKEKETQQEAEVPSPTRTISGTPQKERDQFLQSSQAPVLKRKISLSAKGFSHRFKSTEALPSLLNNPAYQESLNSARTPPATSHPNDSSYMLVGATPNAPAGRKASAAPSDSSIGGGRGLQSQGTFSSRDGSSHGPPNGAPLQHAPTTASMSGGPLNANNIYVSIHETSAKRMATIDYLRKLHEGDIFYFSTLHYSKDSLSSLPSMQAHKLGRRATNYFILGLSLPALLDMNSSNPLEYLKALSSLLQEFETFQNLSGYDSSGNSFSRGRVGQMFKSGIGLGSRGTKGRRSSTSVDTMAGALDPRQADLLGMPATGRSPSDATSPHDTSPINPTGHEFAFLLTPHLPFEPEFATTLATLCETLIDVYARLMDLVSGPDTCTPTVGSEFAKADKAIRKILVANVVREFEDTTRNGVKHEMAGLGKLTLGGLM